MWPSPHLGSFAMKHKVTMCVFMICLSWTHYNGAVVLVDSVPQHYSDDCVLVVDVLNVGSALCTPLPVHTVTAISNTHHNSRSQNFLIKHSRHMETSESFSESTDFR